MITLKWTSSSSWCAFLITLNIQFKDSNSCTFFQTDNLCTTAHQEVHCNQAVESSAYVSSSLSNKQFCIWVKRWRWIGHHSKVNITKETYFLFHFFVIITSLVQDKAPSSLVASNAQTHILAQRYCSTVRGLAPQNQLIINMFSMSNLKIWKLLLSGQPTNISNDLVGQNTKCGMLFSLLDNPFNFLPFSLGPQFMVHQIRIFGQS